MLRRLLILLIVLAAAVGATSIPAAAQITLPFSSPVHPERQPAPADPKSDPESVRAEHVLSQAALALEADYSISATVQYQADLLGSTWTGQGVYLEQRSGPLPLVRIELQIPLQNEPGKLLQVCDGRMLWTYRKLLGDPDLTRVDVSQIAAALEEGRGRAAPAAAEMLIGLGGLPRMLRGLQDNFQFAHANAARLNGMPVWQLHGCWKTEKLADLLPEQREAIKRGQQADLRKLAKHLPDRVLLVFGRSDLFPYRIDYLRAGRNRPLLSMLLSDVKLNVSIPADQFTFRPPKGLKPVDETDAVLESLREK